ncbi:DUF6395 domain-containing protein [Candidatus Sororendozoicomonas aggregata]|uniref:DUF6395 domain-containing protein n=1 Tax=Candidatus Sororendozoicomonas aggregata TaxID=3073239 RepID=UPI002ED2EC5F
MRISTRITHFLTSTLALNVFDSNGNDYVTVVDYYFSLEHDDKVSAKSFNAGNEAISLGVDNVRFFLPGKIEVVHPDLLALAALKIVSPYIGSQVIFEFPVSKKFEESVYKCYKNIKHINSSGFVSSRLPGTIHGMSFSGGADSVGVSALIPENSCLVLSARTFHKDIGKFESWYRTDQNVETLKHMPESFRKISAFSDFEFASTNGKWCIYPDKYAFTIPLLLMADYLKLKSVATGDVLAAFTGNEVKFGGTFSYKDAYIYEAVGLEFIQPGCGLTEVGTEMLARKKGLANISSTCQYGPFQKPCMKCIKCFRKELLRCALDGRMPDEKIVGIWNESPAVLSMANSMERSGAQMLPTISWAFDRIGGKFSGATEKIRRKAKLFSPNSGFAEFAYYSAYRDKDFEYILHTLKTLIETVGSMNSSQQDNFISYDALAQLKNNDVVEQLRSIIR